MSDSRHPTTDELQDYTQEKLSPASNITIAQHITTCNDCSRLLQELAPKDIKLIQPDEVPSRAPKPIEPNLINPSGHSSEILPANPTAQLKDLTEYEIIRELGRGGMGVVYLAQNRLMGRLEVLKILNKSIVSRNEAGERFLAEVQAAARMSHANIVTAYSARLHGDMLVFAMEYIEGEDLQQVVSVRGPLRAQQACYYVYQAARGLQHAHEKGMVHRDIKPHNLILHKSGRKHTIKILDFGLAKVSSEKPIDHGLTPEGKALGTPAYMAPEQIKDARTADIRADIYSLGCTFYYLLSGQPPFQGASLFALMALHLKADPKPIEQIRTDVPPEVLQILSRMMSKDPAQRFQTPAETANALTPFLKQAPTWNPTGSLSPEIANAPGSDRSQFTMDIGKITDTVATEATSLSTNAETKPSNWSQKSPAFSSHRRILATVMISLGFIALLAVSYGVLRVKTPDGTIIVENVPVDADVQIEGSKVDIIRDGDKVTLFVHKGSKYPLKVIHKNGTTLYANNVDLTVAGAPVRVRLEANMLKGPESQMSGKLQAPSPEKLSQLTQAAKSSMKAELASNKPNEVLRTIQLCLTRAASVDSSEMRYALLDLARDLSAKAGDITGSLDICQKIGTQYLVDISELKAKTLQRIAREGVPAGRDESFLDSALSVGFEALATDNFEVARAMAVAADKFTHSKDRENYVYQTSFLAKEIDRAHLAIQAMSKDAQNAVEPTTDASINTARGLYYGLVKNEWSKAVDFLKVGIPALKDIAIKEQSHPETARDRMELGDAWWKAAESLSEMDAKEALRRARYWYLGALARFKPDELATAAARLQPRIDQVQRTPITLRIQLRELSGWHKIRISNDGVVTNFRGTRKITGLIQVNHLQWNDQVEGHHNYGSTRLLPVGVDFSTTQLIHSSHSAWGALSVTCTPEYMELLFWHSPGNLRSNFNIVLQLESNGFNVPTRFVPQWDVAYYQYPQDATFPSKKESVDKLLASEPTDKIKLTNINFISETSPTDKFRPNGPQSDKVQPDYYIIRAKTDWTLPSGRYKVFTYADDGIRVFIDDKVVHDRWQYDKNYTSESKEFSITDGLHKIRIEYYQFGGSARLSFNLVRLGDS